MSKDNSNTTAEKKPVSLLEEAKAIQSYSANFEESKKFMVLLTEISDKAAALGSKITMSRAKVMRLESDTQNVTSRSNPEKAAENILQIGKMWKELEVMAEERAAYQTEYHRLKSLADAVNIRAAEPDNKPIKLNGSIETMRALS